LRVSFVHATIIENPNRKYKMRQQLVLSFADGTQLISNEALFSHLPVGEWLPPYASHVNQPELEEFVSAEKNGNGHLGKLLRFKGTPTSISVRSR
jgi:hypothetical protein